MAKRGQPRSLYSDSLDLNITNQIQKDFKTSVDSVQLNGS